VTETPNPPRIAIIGGGVAGMSAAHALVDRGAAVTVFDKGRGPGGRASTRRPAPPTFDHGAQYFTARDPAFRRAVADWVRAGLAHEWSPRLGVIETLGEITDKPSSDTRYTGVPGMNAIVAHMVRTLDGRSEVRFEQRITRLERDAHAWRLACVDGAPDGAFDAVVVAIPGPQAADLIPDDSPIAAQLETVAMQPCWATMAAFGARLPIDADAVFVNADASPLSWIARDSSKPDRPGGERWVLHASHDWSRERVDRDPDEIATAMLDAFRAATGASVPDPAFARAHLWLYALGSLDPEPGALLDPDRRLVVAGDWCAGGRIEGAYLSGVAAGDRLARTLS